MRTNVTDVFAAGDVAEVDDPLIGAKRALGLWEPARLQGRVAGSNMGGGQAAYRVGVMYNATRLYDLDFAGGGMPTLFSRHNPLICRRLRARA